MIREVIMNKASDIFLALEEETIRNWEEFPDILLYMDQVISLMEDQVYFKKSQLAITPSMVNNYVKAGLLARAEKKKYTRSHLARLSMIGVIKQVFSLKEMESLFSHIGCEREDYENYWQILDRTRKDVLQELEDISREELILHLIMKSYIYKVLAQELLNDNKD